MLIVIYLLINFCLQGWKSPAWLSWLPSSQLRGLLLSSEAQVDEVDWNKFEQRFANQFYSPLKLIAAAAKGSLGAVWESLSNDEWNMIDHLDRARQGLPRRSKLFYYLNDIRYTRRCPWWIKLNSFGITWHIIWPFGNLPQLFSDKSLQIADIDDAFDSLNESFELNSNTLDNFFVDCFLHQLDIIFVVRKSNRNGGSSWNQFYSFTDLKDFCIVFTLRFWLLMVLYRNDFLQQAKFIT